MSSAKSAEMYDDWLATLSGEYVDSAVVMPEFVINFPISLSLVSIAQLHLELDDIDVTDKISISDALLIYPTATQLSQGQHILRLVQYLDDGGIIERGYWQFFTESDGDQPLNSTISASAAIAHRFADSGVDNIARTTVSGDILILHDAVSDSVTSHAELPIILSNNPADDASANVILGDYAASVSSTHISLGIGQQMLDSEQLLLGSGLTNRGLIGTVQTEQQTSSITVFSASSVPLSTFDNFPGIADEENRISGGMVLHKLIDNPDTSVKVAAMYLHGKTTDEGVGIGSEASSQDGDAWGVSVDVYLLQQALHLRTDYASSIFDWDGDGGSDAIRDDAYRVLLNYDFNAIVVGDQYISSQLGVEHSLVGAFYQSPANIGGAVNRLATRLFGRITMDTLSLDAEWSRESDNVDDNDLLDSNRWGRGLLSLNYQPLVTYDDQGYFVPGLLGSQNYAVSYQHEALRTHDLGEGGFTEKLNTRDQTLSLQGDFQYTDWGWSVGYSTIWNDDLNNLVSDTSTDTFSLNTNWVLLQQDLIVSAGLTYDLFHEHDTDIDTESLNLLFDASYVFISEILDANLNINLNDISATDDSQVNANWIVFSALNWQITPIKPTRPGASISLEASYSDFDDDIDEFNSTNTYQVFVKFRVGWDRAF